MIELHIYRHGRTQWNRLGRYQGRAESELDELGIAQADAVARRVAGEGFDLLFSSDSKRCVDVANRIVEATSLKLGLDAHLRERDFGSWSGKTREEVEASYPDEYLRWRNGDSDVKPGGGETCSDVIGRVVAFIQRLRAYESDKKVVAVSHGGWIVSAVQWLTGETTIRKSVLAPSQGSLTILHVYEDKVLLRSYNDIGHIFEINQMFDNDMTRIGTL